MGTYNGNVSGPQPSSQLRMACVALRWDALAVQQAHNQRSGTEGRAQGVCMDGGMRACEGGVATEQRASTPLLRRSRSSILRPTLRHGSDPPWVDVCRRREGSWAAMFCVDSWICVVSVAKLVGKNTATAPSNSGRRPDHDGMLGLFLPTAVPEILHSTGRLPPLVQTRLHLFGFGVVYSSTSS